MRSWSEVQRSTTTASCPWGGGRSRQEPPPQTNSGTPGPPGLQVSPQIPGWGGGSQSSKSPEPNRAMSCARPQLPRAKLWGLRGWGKVANVTGGEGGRGNAFGQTQPGTHKMTSRLGKHRSAALRHRGGGTERGLPRAPDPKTPIKAPTPPPPSPPPHAQRGRGGLMGGRGGEHRIGTPRTKG